jgi:hypothetical protein
MECFSDPSRQQNRDVQMQIIAALPNCQKSVVGGYLKADSSLKQKTSGRVSKRLAAMFATFCYSYPL